MSDLTKPDARGEKYVPCRVEGKFISPCSSLAGAFDGQRLNLLTLSDMQTMEHTRNMVVLKTGQHRKRGVVLNHCPFCGESISKHLKAEAGQ